MPLELKNGVLFIHTKVKGVVQKTTPFTFSSLMISDIKDAKANLIDDIQNVLKDLKMNPSIDNLIYVENMEVYVVINGLSYHIGYIEDKAYNGYFYSTLMKSTCYSVISYQITGKAGTPNVGINLTIQLHDVDTDIIQHIKDQNTIMAQKANE